MHDIYFVILPQSAKARLRKISLQLPYLSAFSLIKRVFRDALNSISGKFEFVFTPTHGSWLNMIEGFFSKMTRQMLIGIRIESKDELKERIYQYFDEINAIPVPYKWKYKMETINLEEENIDNIVYEVVNAKAASSYVSNHAIVK